MSFLLDKFCSFLPPNIASKYTTSKLQQKLLNYFGNAIIVEKQRGQDKSNTVFTNHIEIALVIRSMEYVFDSIFRRALNSYLFCNFSVYKICIETNKMEQSLSGSLHK
jgi:hypothetical protein